MSGTSKFLGCDIESYPGDATMAWLWGHGFRVSGFYLNHSRGSEDDSWISRRAALVGAGWGLAPLYLGWQTVDTHGKRLPPPPDPNAAAATDAAQAVALMKKAGFDADSTVYFDIEDGTPPAGAYQQYLLGWIAAVTEAGFRTAMYCSHLCNEWAATHNQPHWCFHLFSTDPGPYDPGSLPQPDIDAGSVGVQFLQNVQLAGLPVKIDLNWFTLPDPSCPIAPNQAVA
jgi:hypothetical protein